MARKRPEPELTNKQLDAFREEARALLSFPPAEIKQILKKAAAKKMPKYKAANQQKRLNTLFNLLALEGNGILQKALIEDDLIRDDIDSQMHIAQNGDSGAKTSLAGKP